MVSREQQKLNSIDKIISDLAETDPEFWTHEQMDVALNTIAIIVRPDDSTGDGDVFWHPGGPITDDGLNTTDAGWYFWDEASLFQGPYDSFDSANVAVQEYVEALE